MRNRVIALVVALAAVSGSLVAAQTAPAGQEDSTAIRRQINGLRGVPDAERGKVTRDLALKVRQIADPQKRLQLAMGLANLATEGDFGKDTLTEVAMTLAEALKATPQPGTAEKPNPAYITLAQYVRYEHVNVSLDAPQFTGALAKLEADDREREKADFTLNDLSGKPWTLKALQGKVVLVNFWATWCPPCRKEIPDLKALYARFKGKGLVVLAISDEEDKTVRPFAEKEAMNYPVLLDPGRKVNSLYGVQSIPRTLIFDRNGKLAAQSIDMRTERQFLELLAQAGLK